MPFSAIIPDTGLVKKLVPKFLQKKTLCFFIKDMWKGQKNFMRNTGKKRSFLARFVPVVRTFAPIVAGVGEMAYKDFMFFNMAGGFLWSFGLVFAGYFLGKIIPDVDRYILPLVLLIIIISVLPIVFEFAGKKKRQ